MSTEPNQPLFRDLFAGPAITAAEVKNEAIARVGRNANPEWMAAYRRALETVARRTLRFSADEIWIQFEKDYPHPETHDPRAAGAVVVKAMKDGVIIKVQNMFRNSTRRSCHNRPLQILQSMIYDARLAADLDEIERTQ